MVHRTSVAVLGVAFRFMTMKEFTLNPFLRRLEAVFGAREDDVLNFIVRTISALLSFRVTAHLLVLVIK